MFMKTAESSKRSIMVPSVGLEPTCSKRSVAVWVPNVYQFHHDGMVLKYCATSASVVFLLTYRNRPNRDFFICLPVSSISLIVWWCCKKNSNLQPIAYKAIALPIELLQQILAPILGIEPRTYGLTVRRSTY